MRKRDLFIFFVSLLAIFISFQQEGEYTLSLRFKIPIDTSGFRNAHFPEEDEKMPKPIVTDLDGDGKKEMVAVTTDYRVVIYNLENLSQTKENQPPEPSIKNQATLVGKVGAKKGRRPIGLGVGHLYSPHIPVEVHLEEEATEGGNMTEKQKQQHILLVTEDLVVLCFNHNLKLMWETNINAFAHPYLGVPHSATVLVSPFQARKGDHGLVVIGCDTLIEESEPTFEHEHGSEDTSQVSSSYGVSDHFSYYAFDGRTGALRWKHEPEDFQDIHEHGNSTSSTFELPIGNENFKLHILKTSKHLGEVPWNHYKDNVLGHLPHRWRSREDTKLEADFFKRRRQFGTKNEQEAKKKTLKKKISDVGLPTENLFSSGIVHSSTEEHSSSPHNANVIVTHNKFGIEVVHLYSGRPLCRLFLQDNEKTSLYSDLNNDGIIEHIKVGGGGPTGENDYCSALTTSGIPPIEVLYNISVCKFNDISILRQNQNFPVQSAAPLFFSSHNWPLRGANSVVFFVSSGLITATDARGRVLWQTHTESTWSPLYKSEMLYNPLKMFQSILKQTTGSEGVEGEETETTDELLAPFGSIESIFLDEEKTKLGVIAVGWGLTLLSERGEILSQATIDGISIAPILVEDLNNDHHNDLLVTTNDGYLAFNVIQRKNFYLFPILVFVLLAATAILFVRNVATQTVARKSRKAEMKWAM